MRNKENGWIARSCDFESDYSAFSGLLICIWERDGKEDGT